MLIAGAAAWVGYHSTVGRVDVGGAIGGGVVGALLAFMFYRFVADEWWKGHCEHQAFTEGSRIIHLRCESSHSVQSA